MSTRYPCGNAPGAAADAVLVAGARTRACCAPQLDEARPSPAARPPELGDDTVAICVDEKPMQVLERLWWTDKLQNQLRQAA